MEPSRESDGKKMAAELLPRPPGHRQIFPCPSARHVQQVPLGIDDLLEVGVVADGVDAGLERQHLVVAGHDQHRPELPPLRQVHGADGAHEDADLVRGDAGAGGAGDAGGADVRAFDEVALRGVEEDRPPVPGVRDCALQLFDVADDAQAATGLTPLVGRLEELARLESLFASAAAGARVPHLALHHATLASRRCGDLALVRYDITHRQ